jgi:hypothetical protein
MIHRIDEDSRSVDDGTFMRKCCLAFQSSQASCMMQLQRDMFQWRWGGSRGSPVVSGCVSRLALTQEEAEENFNMSIGTGTGTGRCARLIIIVIHTLSTELLHNSLPRSLSRDQIRWFFAAHPQPVGRPVGFALAGLGGGAGSSAGIGHLYS